jgi:hypothetical protein
MALRTLLPQVVLAPMLAAAAYAGSIDFTGTASSDRTVLNVTIVDDGGAEDCENFWITRGGELRYFIPRIAGTTTYEFTDTEVQPNTQYRYDLKGYRYFVAPSDQYEFCRAFDDAWCRGFRVWANWGPVPIGRGRLIQDGRYGDPWSAGVAFIACGGNENFAQSMGVPAEFQPYIDSGETVFVRGHWFRVSQQHGDGVRADEIVPDHCPPTAAESSTWSHVKRTYRDP